VPLFGYLTAQTRRLPTGAQAPVALLGDAATTRKLLETAGAERPALMFTCTHGVEFPADPRRWGALTSVDHAEPHGDPLSVDALAGQPFAMAAWCSRLPASAQVSPGKSTPGSRTSRVAPRRPRQMVQASAPRTLAEHRRPRACVTACVTIGRGYVVVEEAARLLGGATRE
jgi:hypothetical protein